MARLRAINQYYAEDDSHRSTFNVQTRGNEGKVGLKRDVHVRCCATAENVHGIVC